MTIGAFDVHSNLSPAFTIRGLPTSPRLLAWKSAGGYEQASRRLQANPDYGQQAGRSTSEGRVAARARCYEKGPQVRIMPTTWKLAGQPVMGPVGKAAKQPEVAVVRGRAVASSMPSDCDASTLSFREKLSMFSKGNVRASSDPGPRCKAEPLKNGRRLPSHMTRNSTTRKHDGSKLDQAIICVPRIYFADFGIAEHSQASLVPLVGVSQFNNMNSMREEVGAEYTHDRGGVRTEKTGCVKQPQQQPILVAACDFITGGQMSIENLSFAADLLSHGGYQVVHCVIACVYLDRGLLGKHLEEPTWRTMFTLAVLLADKFWSDDPLRSTDLLSTCACINPGQLLSLELKFMALLGWRAFVQPQEVRSFCERALGAKGLPLSADYKRVLASNVIGRAEALNPLQSGLADRDACILSSRALHCNEELKHGAFNARANIGLLRSDRDSGQSSTVVNWFNDSHHPMCLTTPPSKQAGRLHEVVLLSSEKTLCAGGAMENSCPEARLGKALAECS